MNEKTMRKVRRALPNPCFGEDARTIALLIPEPLQIQPKFGVTCNVFDNHS
ncbi:hypothetical protein ACPOL_3773 [Acidisarcina polymorpha]|uniref:Uncharacterized protein n=1 Tax=Acidisarcina polymorpha TaxID=2211140 RepID=A0A2Z5G1V3_9BACT|nr:hypothetical protein ACPOL_3773 [Acidisarcina polymorpha]